MNAVVVEADGTWTLRFSRGSGWGTAMWLLGQPAEVLDEYRSWQVADWWYDEVWAEASVLADVRGRELHFFCCAAELMRPVPLRRRYLQLLRACWPGWKVSWAYGGVAGIVGLLGLDPGMVVADMPARPLRWIVPPQPRPRWYELVTVRDVAG